MEFSTKGTKLEVKAAGESTWKEAYGLYNTPDMGGNKEKIDVTNLSDSHKRTIDGIADYGSLQFDFYDTKGESDTSAMIKKTYAAFRGWELAGTEVAFKLTYPDGSGFNWTGTVLTVKDAAAVILDSQYTVEEAFAKVNWGHSAFCYAIDFAVHWNIKNIYLFHHEPTYDDKKLNSILQAARWYAQYINHAEIEIYLAKEDMEVEI